MKSFLFVLRTQIVISGRYAHLWGDD